MAEIIVSEISKLVLRQLSSVAIEEVKLALGLEDELNRIKSNLSSIQAVLRDAEKQQSTSDSVQIWLQKLQDVMYDIDDLLDEIAADVTIQQKNKGRLRKQVRKFFSRYNSLVLRSQRAHQIKNLRKKLDWIKDERNSLVLFSEPADPSGSTSRETYAKVNKSEILGRDRDKDAIINHILNSRDCESLSVLPIVGFGGVGKSTIAKLIYSDHRIDESFDKKLWVYVSEKFKIKKILNQILSLVTGKDEQKLIMEGCTLEELRIKISEALQNTKYILILDDFWNENSNEWRRLKELLDVGAKGSMVVVTTRDLNVASMVKSVDEYTLRELSDETCLRIFKHLAFEEGEKIEPSLWNLAKSIVKKSRGLPLLVTTLGNLLHGERDEREWHRVIWKLEQGHEDILNILKLSYDQLPSYLKLSFRICSVWSKGAKINPFYHLSPFLMALGFLPHDAQGGSLEYNGQRCINELLSKSLLQKPDNGIHDIDMFSDICMHDFIHDLAQSMAGDELAILNCSSQEVPEKVRYMRLEEEDLSGKQCHIRLLSKAKKTRLLLINPLEHSVSKALMESVMSNLKRLRVLHLKFCQFEELPRTIGNMKHLRYISLVGNIGIVKLPNSICNLFNLQTLLIGGCSNLQKLPDNLWRLENLRCFSVTTQQELLPETIGLLKALRTLVLYECPRLVSLPDSINTLENLDSLWITGCTELDLAHGSWSHNGLNKLRFLSINYLPKFTRLPISEKGVSFASLQTLVVDGCEGLSEQRDWIEHLTSLKTLVIGDWIESIYDDVGNS